MTSPSPKISIAIIGAGIGGIILSIALSSKNQNLEITIYESRPAFSEIGAGVGLGPNAVRAMSLISPDILHAFDKVKTANGDPEKSHVWYAFRNGQEEESNREEPIMEIASEIVHCNASRVQFLDGLVKLIPKSVKVEFGKKVIDVIPSADGKGQMKIIFEGGLEREANAVIGCDGIRSACRRILLGQDSRAIYSGKYAYRKVVNMEKAVEVVGEEVRNRLIYLGKGGHVLMFPIRRGEMLNVVAFKDGGEKEWADKRWVVPSDREDLLEDFKGWNRKVRNILKLMEAPERWALFDHLPGASTYAKNNFCLLGDAAHATTPHCGAGAGFAIEDAHLLSGLLTPDLIQSVDDVQHAFRAYDEMRRPRCEELVKKSRANGMLFDLQDGGDVTEDELWGDLEKKMQWVWNVDLVGMLENGRALLRKYKNAG